MSITIDPNNHAYVILGNPETVIDERVVPSVEETLSVSVQANPDVLRTHHESFGIDDARRVCDFASKKAINGTQVFILSFDAITLEAQNALLKTLEEPTPNTYFFIVITSSELLLPTVLSRTQLIALEQGTSQGHYEFAQEILAARPGERLSLVKSLLENKDKVQILRLLDSLETQLYQTLTREGSMYTKVFYEIMLVREYMRDRSPSIKVLIEHLLLTLPIIPMEKSK